MHQPTVIVDSGASYMDSKKLRFELENIKNCLFPDKTLIQVAQLINYQERKINMLEQECAALREQLNEPTSN